MSILSPKAANNGCFEISTRARKAHNDTSQKYSPRLQQFSAYAPSEPEIVISHVVALGWHTCCEFAPLFFESLCNFSIHNIPQHNYTFYKEPPSLLSVCYQLLLFDAFWFIKHRKHNLLLPPLSMLHTLSDKSSHAYKEQTIFPQTDVQNQPEKTHKQKKWNQVFKSFLGWKRRPSFFKSCLWTILCPLRLSYHNFIWQIPKLKWPLFSSNLRRSSICSLWISNLEPPHTA